MTYLQFLLLFIAPPLLLLWGLPGRARGARQGLAALALPLIALVYTTPWDNYLVATGVWAYGSDRVLGTIGYVPVEEYLFMLLQSLLSLAWLVRCRLAGADAVEGELAAPVLRASGAAAWLLAALAGVLLLGRESTRYLGLIVAWAAPVLAAQWWFTGDVLAQRSRRYLAVVAGPVLYLWLADGIAIHLGIWEISARHTTGWHVLGLPVEEMTFFLLTHLLAVHGALLLLEPWRLGAAFSRAGAAPRAPVPGSPVRRGG